MYEKILHKVEQSWDFPWPKPKNQYDSDGPLEPIVVPIRGVAFRVAPTAEMGIHTGRTRYLVICCDCQEILHVATTGPSSRIRHHIQEKHQSETTKENA